MTTLINLSIERIWVAAQYLQDDEKRKMIQMNWCEMDFDEIGW